MSITSDRLRWLESLIRQDKMIPFYKCKEWRSLRLEALERDNYECQQCKRKGKYTRGQNVHHLREVKDRPDLALTLENLETVCIPCHNAIHDKRLKNDKRKPFVNEERW
ncbi:HNH endonuclease [Heyndrickxia sporothermodurans]|uniref:HNH endonuclease n=1 Tax=Heyndrickxia sporothermodurans TaxID=46224 RepID=UPI000D3D3D18|nr:HNH endonuclease signature motif containing protein [Heyndrickxia sporothermodurans]